MSDTPRTIPFRRIDVCAEPGALPLTDDPLHRLRESGLRRQPGLGMAAFLNRLQVHIETPNLGVVDCLVRIVLGLVVTAFAVDGTIGPWGCAVGLLSMVTGAAWVCPVYKLLGISTVSRSMSHP